MTKVPCCARCAKPAERVRGCASGFIHLACVRCGTSTTGRIDVPTEAEARGSPFYGSDEPTQKVMLATCPKHLRDFIVSEGCTYCTEDATFYGPDSERQP